MNDTLLLDWLGQNWGWLLLLLAALGALGWRQSRMRRSIALTLLTMLLLQPLFALLAWGGAVRWFSPSWLHQLQVLLTGVLLLRLLGMLLFHLLLPLVRFTPPRIIEDILMALCYIGWGMLRLHSVGVELGQIVTTSAVITAVIAFAMQDTLGNLLAGIALQLDNSLHIGDWIAIDNLNGRVVEINWRATSIETRNWETVIVPNGMLLKQHFTILGRRRGQPLQWRRWVWFDITLDTLPTQIIQLVEKALREASLPGVSHEPAPNCILMSVERGIGHYAVRYWLTDLAADDPTDSAMRTLIDAALRRNDRRMTAPVFNVFMNKEHEYVDARHKRHTAERVATLRNLPLFAMLNEDELTVLADQLKFTPFVLGDAMLEQHQISDWLYILIRGSADMVCLQPDGHEIKLDVLQPGDFFGELGLLTGEPSHYGVRAAGNAECYRVSRQVFQQVFSQRPELLGMLTRVLQQREEEQQSLLDRDARHAGHARQEGELLASVRSFFGWQ